MSQKNNWKDALAGGLVFLTGAVVGGALTALAMTSKPKKAGEVLEIAKREFVDYGRIVGSWIDYDITVDNTYESKPEVYVGGISVERNDVVSHFEFTADVYTGHVIEVNELNLG